MLFCKQYFNLFSEVTHLIFHVSAWVNSPNWLDRTIYMPGEAWTNGEDEPLPETINERGEISSIDGTLAIDDNPVTYWNVNPNGK